MIQLHSCLFRGDKTAFALNLVDISALSQTVQRLTDGNAADTEQLPNRFLCGYFFTLRQLAGVDQGLIIADDLRVSRCSFHNPHALSSVLL